MPVIRGSLPRWGPEDGKRPLPLVSVLVDFELLAGRVCELAHTTPGKVITPGTLTNLFEQPEGVLIERVVFDPPSRQITDLSHQRLYTGGLRRVIQLRDRCCTWPGCTVPAEHCQLDHKTPWHKGGPTTQTNPFCDRKIYKVRDIPVTERVGARTGWGQAVRASPRPPTPSRMIVQDA